jgi:hypothetical protein
MIKEFQLSTKKERILSVCFCVVMIAALGVLVYALRSNTMLLILCGLFGLLLSVLMLFSVNNMLKAKCIVNTEAKTLEVKGTPSYTKDISSAVLLQTMAKKNSQATSRMLVFSDAEENVIATIPTLFTSRQGILAEPMAKEMAQFLGIDFKENVPAWEYDKAAYEQHLKDEAEREKAERKERQEMRRKKILYRYQKRNNSGKK